MVPGEFCQLRIKDLCKSIRSSRLSLYRRQEGHDASELSERLLNGLGGSSNTFEQMYAASEEWVV